MTIGRPRIYSNEERLSRKRVAHEQWKSLNWEYYSLQKRLLMSRPEYAARRKELRKLRQPSSVDSEMLGGMKECHLYVQANKN